MLELAKNYGQGPVSMSQISKLQDIPIKYLEQLIIPLKKARLVTSVRGPKGGHMLAKSPKRISIWEVLKLLESKHSLVDCLSDSHACENAQDCPVRPIWGEAYKCMTRLFKDTSLQDVLENRVGKSPMRGLSR
jgi:Rrf2 family protein